MGVPVGMPSAAGGVVGAGGGSPSPETSALMSLTDTLAQPQSVMGTQGPMLRTLGRRMYPQESMALASMGRVY
jgi:hypothetical protein